MTKSTKKGNTVKMGNTKLTLRDVIIEAIHAQTDIDTANELVQESTSSVSNHLLVVAKNFHDAGKFIEACKVQEDFIKSKEAGKNQADKLPRCWTNAKSNIKRALELGFDLSEYKTESELRKAVTEKRQKESEGDSKPVIDPKLLNSDDEGNDPRLIQYVNALMKKLAEVTGDGVDEAIEVIDNTINEIDRIILALVPEEPVKGEEEKTPESATA